MNRDQEIVVLENTLKILRKGKYELSGDEALVFYSSFDYLIKRIQELKKPVVSSEPLPAPIPKADPIKTSSRRKKES